MYLVDKMVKKGKGISNTKFRLNDPVMGEGILCFWGAPKASTVLTMSY